MRLQLAAEETLESMDDCRLALESVRCHRGVSRFSGSQIAEQAFRNMEKTNDVVKQEGVKDGN